MSERPRELLDELERRAREAAEEADSGEELDLIRVARGDIAPDLTIGGYADRHDRPAAFEGSNGQPYTVAIEVEETGDPERPWAAFLVFIRWAETGAGIMDHVESEDVAYGESEEAAREAASDLTLYEAKAELDAAIERKRRLLEE